MAQTTDDASRYGGDQSHLTLDRLLEYLAQRGPDGFLRARVILLPRFSALIIGFICYRKSASNGLFVSLNLIREGGLHSPET